MGACCCFMLLRGISGWVWLADLEVGPARNGNDVKTGRGRLRLSSSSRGGSLWMPLSSAIEDLEAVTAFENELKGQPIGLKRPLAFLLNPPLWPCCLQRSSCYQSVALAACSSNLNWAWWSREDLALEALIVMSTLRHRRLRFVCLTSFAVVWQLGEQQILMLRFLSWLAFGGVKSKEEIGSLVWRWRLGSSSPWRRFSA